MRSTGLLKFAMPASDGKEPKGAAVSYMVIFRTPEGKPGYQQAEDVHEVVGTVERLRNEEGVENVRIYRMDEVAFEYKVHYTVELKDPSAGGGEAPSGAPAPEALSWDDDDTAGAEEPAAAEPEGGTSPGQPFDQMAAVDTTEPPRWGDTGGDAETIDVGSEGEDAAAGARRGLFGR